MDLGKLIENFSSIAASGPVGWIIAGVFGLLALWIVIKLDKIQKKAAQDQTIRNRETEQGGTASENAEIQQGWNDARDEIRGPRNNGQ